MIGTVLDKYEILQKVGEGGMATVYRGRHLTLGRDVAIKVLHPHLSASPRNRQRFAREARAIEHLDHDNILKIYDYSGTDAEDCFIVTEFVDGVTLQRLIVDRGRLPSEVVSLIGVHLAVALEYAHGAGIIHRDLKPENVMLRRDGTVKLMDFGIARFLDEVNLTVTGALVGSPAYMSPEQAMERVLDPRSDLFSLGTLLFHIATGQLPFSGGNPSLILRNIIDGKRPEVTELTPDLSGGLADMIERLLQTNPAGRPQSAAEVREALERALSEVKIGLDDPKWSLQVWLQEPGSYEARLKVHLKEILLSEGRSRLGANDTLGALRLLNRLLAMDEDNPEVLELVQGMHAASPSAAPPSRRWRPAAAAAAAFLIGISAWGLAQRLLREPEGVVEPPEPPTSELPPPSTVGAAQSEEPSESPVPVLEASHTPTTSAPTRPRDRTSGGHSRTASPASGGSPASATTSAPAALAAEASPDPPARVTVLVPGTWANFFIDNQKVGRTGAGPLTVSPGTHTLRVENDLSLPYTTTFTVAPGEERTIEITALQRKPVIVRFEPDLDGACRVVVDEVERGTLQGLAYTFQILEPDTSHTISLSCPDGKPRAIRVPEVLPGAVLKPTFP